MRQGNVEPAALGRVPNIVISSHWNRIYFDHSGRPGEGARIHENWKPVAGS